MEPIVKYHFDREMVAFVKTLELKPAMFGYEKNDVFNKFKDLLVKAREVCEELVAGEHRKLEEFREAVIRAKDDPDALNALLADWDEVSVGETGGEAVLESDLPAADLKEEPQEDSFHAALTEQLDSEADDSELFSLREENASLRAELASFAAIIEKKDSEGESAGSELLLLREENSSLRQQLEDFEKRLEEESNAEILRLREENSSLQARLDDYAQKEAGWDESELSRLREENASLQARLAEYAEKEAGWDEAELHRLREENASLQVQVADFTALFDQLDDEPEGDESAELHRLREENASLQVQVADYASLFDQLDSETQADDSGELLRLQEENASLQTKLADYAALFEQDGDRQADGLEAVRLREENAALQARLADYAEREELLQKAHAIVTEAQLEKVQIVRSAQVDAEQELFLYRAKRRDEEEAFKKEMIELEAKRQKLVEVKDRYQGLVNDGDQLFEQMKAYAERLSYVQENGNLAASGFGELNGVPFDPPVLTVDEVHGCTEEAMPLCEIAEEEPESIFAEPDYSAVPQDNFPQEEDHQAECEDQH